MRYGGMRDWEMGEGIDKRKIELLNVYSILLAK